MVAETLRTAIPDGQIVVNGSILAAIDQSGSVVVAGVHVYADLEGCCHAFLWRSRDGELVGTQDGGPQLRLDAIEQAQGYVAWLREQEPRFRPAPHDPSGLEEFIENLYTDDAR